MRKQKPKKGKRYMVGGVPCVIFNEPGPNMLASIREGQSAQSESKETAQKRMAEAYARWLAARDGVKLPDDVAGRIEFDGWGKSKRVKAVQFARYRDSGGSYWSSGRREWFEVIATIEIPNWDFEQRVIDLSDSNTMREAA